MLPSFLSVKDMLVVDRKNSRTSEFFGNAQLYFLVFWLFTRINACSVTFPYLVFQSHSAFAFYCYNLDFIMLTVFDCSYIFILSY